MNQKIIEKVKTSESTISMVLGIVVVVVVGILLFNYFKNFLSKPKLSEDELASKEQTEELTKSPEETGKETIYEGELPTRYSVAKGDSLWKISLKFYGSGYNWVDIAKENKIKNANLLEEGQELIIPKAEIKKQKIQTEEKRGNLIEGGSYVVVKGDNLWEVSVRAYQDGYKWPEIAKANKLTNPNIIHPGNTLTIPR